jgi:hypothetical protein
MRLLDVSGSYQKYKKGDVSNHLTDVGVVELSESIKSIKGGLSKDKLTIKNQN